MTRKDTLPPTPPEQAPADYVGDEHWGRGGRYIVNPQTGRREPAPADADTAEPKE